MKITGIDMTAAFDTNNIKSLLKILEKVVQEDELSLIQFLLSKTQINIGANKAYIQASFTTYVGTSQGNGLNPVLFTIYLEHALKEARKVLGNPRSSLEEVIPREIAYAGDVDFIG
ncbi:very-long-chain enoyl-coa reductase [Plakobranchus ocellatus]|uniref:Very-long-chain enoyl-coa reductase n=1 Tax=Plakobranchus ocellatus TaxID=259542 RepID=A0AAV4CPE4_9GAST|nr:very-long-chain enoyl-coa reductase [Plakobranchus ocellatus]